MTKKEYDTLLRNIRGIYPSFRGDEVLLNYKYSEVYKNFANYGGTETPTYDDLLDGLNYESEKDVWMQCDLCKEKIHYTTWDDFDRHHRRCEKIDFINRQAKELGGRGIDYNYYRTMSDRELDERYNKIMANWENNHKDLTLKSLFNTL